MRILSLSQQKQGSGGRKEASLPLDGAAALGESPVGVEAVQARGHRAYGGVMLQAADAAIGVEGVGEGLALLHVGV